MEQAKLKDALKCEVIKMTKKELSQLYYLKKEIKEQQKSKLKCNIIYEEEGSAEHV